MNTDPGLLMREMDRDHLWHPYTSYIATQKMVLPIMVRGEGVYLYDDSGRQYLDAISSWWAVNLGHSHPELVAALREQAGILQHSILGSSSHPLAIELSQRLAKLCRDSRRHVLFASDGASAVEASLKVALQYWRNMGLPQKTRVLTLDGAYHGDTLGCVAVGYVDSLHSQYRGLINPAQKTPLPPCLSRSDCSCMAGKPCSAIDSLEKTLTMGKDAIAAIIVEPICQGAGGMRTYSPEFLLQVARLSERNQILLIADEIAMGFGRTGKMFAHMHADIDPDIVCIGKGLTNGYVPMSAALVKDHIYHSFADTDPASDRSFYHGNTFGGNPLACAVALKVLDIYERDGVVTRAHNIGVVLNNCLATLTTLPIVASVRSIGMVGAIELRDTPETSKIVSATLEWMFNQQILVRSLGRVIYLMPPLIASERIVADVIQKLHSALRTLSEAHEPAIAGSLARSMELS